MSKFNLIDEPWIPVLKADGTFARIGLKECLMQAHEISEIYHDSPLVVAGVYRLLFTMVYRLFSPKNSAEWKVLWSAGNFDRKTIEAYSKEWYGRFFLFDEKYPFYQMAEHPAGDEKQSINKIVLHRAAGNNAVYFDHSNEQRPDPLTPAEAMLNLLAFQLYSPGGGKSKTINLQHSPLTSPLVIFLLGDNLFQTIVLNTLINLQIRTTPEDKPYWEQNGEIVFNAESRVKGYLDYLTLQSRIVKLLYKETDAGILVDSVQIAQGRGLDKDILEPYAKYKLNKDEGLVPLRVSVEKQLWRDYNSLISISHSETGERPPLNLKQAAELEESGILREGFSYQIFCCGMATDKAKILLWRNEKLPLPLEFLRNQDFMKLVNSAISIAGENARLLWKRTNTAARQLISYDISSADKETTRQIQKTISTETMYWAMLETSFKEFVVQASTGEEAEGPALREWKDSCIRACEKCWALVEDSIIHSTYGPEAIAKAFNNIK